MSQSIVSRSVPAEPNWELLLAVAAKVGVRVWRANSRGELVPVESVDEIGVVSQSGAPR